MSKDHVTITMDTVPSNPDRRQVDLSDIEMVFGTPSSGKTDTPDTHLIHNERVHGRDDNGHAADDGNHSDPQSQPLLEPTLPPQLPPLAGPEIDDLNGDNPVDNTPFPGIDDGLLEPGGNKDSTPELIGDDDSTHKFNDSHDNDFHPEGNGGDTANGDGKWESNSKHGNDETDFYYGDFDIHNRFGEDGVISPIPTIPGSIPDVNTYQQKKNLAQGMMDLALLSANANQLRYVLEAQTSQSYYYLSIVLIGMSIILQVMVGVGLIMNSRYNVKDEKEICKADKINNMTVLGVFLITIVNVFVTSFSVPPATAAVATIATAATAP